MNHYKWMMMPQERTQNEYCGYNDDRLGSILKWLCLEEEEDKEYEK